MARDDEDDRLIRGGYRSEIADIGVSGLFKKSWWALALRGVLAIVLAIVMLTWPGRALRVFIATLGVYFFLDGLFTLAGTFHAAEKGHGWWPYVVEGLVSVALGILAFARPHATAWFLLFLVAARAIVVGIAEITTAMAVRRTTGMSAALLLLGGIVSVGFAIVLIASPRFGMLTLVWLTGIYTIAFGIALDAQAFRLRSVQHQLSRSTSS
jgi:uncharacterized membrane protein HdeD (DUF308 family)